MAGDETRYPILVDTDALIAVANSSLWKHLTEHVGLTTTNVCKQGLKRHVENTRETELKGTVRTDFITEAVPRSMRLRILRRRLHR